MLRARVFLGASGCEEGKLSLRRLHIHCFIGAVLLVGLFILARLLAHTEGAQMASRRALPRDPTCTNSPKLHALDRKPPCNTGGFSPPPEK